MATRLPQQKVEAELARYRTHVTDEIPRFAEELAPYSTRLRLFSSDDRTPLEVLKQCALYIDEYVVADPLFALSEPRNANVDVFNQGETKDVMSRLCTRRRKNEINFVVCGLNPPRSSRSHSTAD
jgi:hypothetical protein